MCACSGLALTLSLCFQQPWPVYVVCVCVCVCVWGEICVCGGRYVCACVWSGCVPLHSCSYACVQLYICSTCVKSGRQRVDNRGWCHIVFMSSWIEKQLGKDCAFCGLGCECILLNICIKALPPCVYRVCLHNVTYQADIHRPNLH